MCFVHFLVSGELAIILFFSFLSEETLLWTYSVQVCTNTIMTKCVNNAFFFIFYRLDMSNLFFVPHFPKSAQITFFFLPSNDHLLDIKKERGL